MAALELDDETREKYVALYSRYPSDIVHEIDWSGITAVIVCNACGLQEGAFFSQDEAKAACVAHRQAIHAELPGKIITPCKWEGCEKRSTARGLCQLHLSRARTVYRDLYGPWCERDGCTKGVASNGLCRTHNRATPQVRSPEAKARAAAKKREAYVPREPKPLALAQPKPLVHGLSAYRNGHCRCDTCRAASRDYERKRRAA